MQSYPTILRVSSGQRDDETRLKYDLVHGGNRCYPGKARFYISKLYETKLRATCQSVVFFTKQDQYNVCAEGRDPYPFIHACIN